MQEEQEQQQATRLSSSISTMIGNSYGTVFDDSTELLRCSHTTTAITQQYNEEGGNKKKTTVWRQTAGRSKPLGDESCHDTHECLEIMHDRGEEGDQDKDHDHAHDSYSVLLFSPVPIRMRMRMRRGVCCDVL